mmetsp:Transcript_16246/g.48923  ORF Transcript_16246/g.48923 Transcript_16246/m.48923 type:complete len:303 (+) Transcript_16246:214-1122(+)
MAPRGVAFVAFAALAAATAPRSSPKPSDDAELEEPKMKKMSAYLYYSQQNRPAAKQAVDEDPENAEMSAGDKHIAVVKKLGAMWKALEKADQEKWKEDAPMVEVKPRKEVKTKFASRVESLGRRDGSELLKANGESWASALVLVGEIKYIGTEMTAIESEPSPYFQVYKGGGSRAREVTDRRLALAAAALLAVEGLVDRFSTRRKAFAPTHALVLPRRVELARLRLELGLAVPGEDGVRRPYGELRPSREPHPCLRGRNPTHDLLDRCLGDARRYRTRVADAHDDLAALVSARARARRRRRR